jgi:hypothetical protein
MRSLAVLILVLAFATQAHAQTCTVGVRCGNTCISRNDVCRIDDAQRGDGGYDPTLVYVLIGSLAAVAITSLVIAIVLTPAEERGCFGLPFCGGPSPSAPSSPFGDDVHPVHEAPLRPSIAGMTIDEDRAFWRCLDRLCAGNPCREELAAMLRAARDKTAWLVERKCIARPASRAKPEAMPVIDGITDDQQAAFSSCMARLCPVDGLEPAAQCAAREARSLAHSQDRALWLSARECGESGSPEP